MTEDNKELDRFWTMGLDTIKELETEKGILASGRGEVFGCIFGRDSLITALFLLQVYESTHEQYFLQLVKKILLNLAELQGQSVNIESGEQPGKCIHEFRPTGYEHLTSGPNAWYIYEDNILRNYDTVDATPLFLIAIHRYYNLSQDEQFIQKMLAYVNLALLWIFKYGDSNGDGFIDYYLNPDRKHGGLAVQNWMDSIESLFHEDGSIVPYPIAPIEVQAYTYLALKLWSDFFEAKGMGQSEKLNTKAELLKQDFNNKFVLTGKDEVSFAQDLDGNNVPFTTLRSSMGHCLWAAYKKDGAVGTIMADKFIPALVKQLMSPELFEPDAGIRTLSKNSSKFEPNSYHNGSIWPHDNAMIAQGLENFGYHDEAVKVYSALLHSYKYFQTPLELFSFKDGQFLEYISPTGQGACRKQAWSAGAMLVDVLALRGAKQA